MIAGKINRHRSAASALVLAATMVLMAGCAMSSDSAESESLAAAPTTAAENSAIEDAADAVEDGTDAAADATDASVDPADGTAESVAEGSSASDDQSAPGEAADTAEDDAAAVQEAVAIGERFMQARASHDAEALAPLLAPDVSFGNAEFAGSVEEFAIQLEWERVMGWQFIDPTCTAGTADRVVCAYSIQDAVSDGAGEGPFSGNSFLLELSDGLIQRSSHNFNAEEFFPVSERRFILWLRNNHPDDFPVMLDDRPFPIAPVLLTPESIVLWELHLEEYLTEPAS